MGSLGSVYLSDRARVYPGGKRVASPLFSFYEKNTHVWEVSATGSLCHPLVLLRSLPNLQGV